MLPVRQIFTCLYLDPALTQAIFPRSDLDVLLWYMQPHKLARVSSFGNLSHFKKSKKPAAAGSAKRCFDCPAEVSDKCPYSAKTSASAPRTTPMDLTEVPYAVYLEPTKRGNVGWPVDTITQGPPDLQSVTKALEETDYGACVYELENDVVDHQVRGDSFLEGVAQELTAPSQVVNLEFENGATASLTMVAFTTLVCERQTRIQYAFTSGRDKHRADGVDSLQLFAWRDHRRLEFSPGHRLWQPNQDPRPLPPVRLCEGSPHLRRTRRR